jgi:hypothetical protein
MSDSDDLFVYKTMSVAFRVALDELLDDYSKYIADPVVKQAVIKILMLRVKKAEKYINMELAKRAIALDAN